jgi:hypothetical protein
MASIRITVFALALGSAIACAGPAVQIMSTSHGDRNDPVQRGYDVGYDRGRSASARGARPDSRMPGDEKNPQTVAGYTEGYEDGYAGRANRFGAVEARDWMHEDGVPTSSDDDADERGF